MSAAVLKLIGTATVLAFALTACNGDDDPIAPIVPEDATVYFVHGIPGTEIGEEADELPVDVRFGTSCVATNVTFGTISQAIAVAPGTYNVDVLAAGETACGGEVLLTLADMQLAEAANVSLVAHLSGDGTQTALTRFNNDLSTAEGSRVIARHTAAFGPVDVLVDGEAAFTDLSSGEQEATVLTAGTYDVAVTPAGEEEPLFEAAVPVVAGQVVIAYAIGNPDSDNFMVLTQQLTMN